MSRSAWLMLAAAYLALIACVVWGMLVYRQTTLASLDTLEARAAWQQWRDASARQSAEGPVLRKPIRSSAPPAEVLLRDYFPTLLAGAVFFSSLFFCLLVWIVRGAVRTSVHPDPAAADDAIMAQQTGPAFAAESRRRKLPKN